MTALEKRWLGRRFGRLTVKALYAHGDKTHPCEWMCICDCGCMKVATTAALISGDTKSCGCLRRETAKKTGHNNKVHGNARRTRTRLYRIWSGMKTRCTNKASKDFDRYGGRGIRICDEWMNDFVKFREWALQNGYSDELSIDRIDVNGNYCPNNCRWATAKEQAQNRRKMKCEEVERA